DPAATLNRVARALAAAEPLRARLVRGLDLAVLPATADGPAEEPVYQR
ncbi:SseB family protein, partial [Streptomyces albidoflavus]|nr:SseB family protein [Streptomyces albidoflavus]